MVINFKKFPVYSGISKSSKMAMDISESLADCIYSSVPGINAHVLAEKILKSSEAVELDADEVAMIRNITPTLPGKFADSINDHLKDMEEKQ